MKTLFLYTQTAIQWDVGLKVLTYKMLLSIPNNVMLEDTENRCYMEIF